jgi:hypothetical protein
MLLDNQVKKVVVGDEMLLEFGGQSPDEPRIIGWRPEPRPGCGYNDWGEIINEEGEGEA